MGERDPLSDLLRVLRVNGSLVLHDTYALPWSVAVPDSTRLAQLGGIPPTDHVVAFHLVQRGHLEVTDAEGGRTAAGRGDLMIGFGGAPHELSCGDGALSIPLEALVNPGDDTAGSSNTPDEVSTTLLCGVFSLGAVQHSPLAGALPPVVHVRAGNDDNFDALASLLGREVASGRPGSAFAISRLLELLCAEALRQVAATATADEPGWLRALADPVVFAAMSAVHRAPGSAWTVRRLADEVALSPSRLTARFRAILGESPMSYVTGWRMIIAGQLLTDTDVQIQQVAEQVGYSNQPSFSRAFHRAYGRAPRDHRAQRIGAGH